MTEADESIIKTAKDALTAGKTVLVAIRDLHVMQILEIHSSGGVVTIGCPGSEELGVGASQLTIRANDLLGVSVFT